MESHFHNFKITYYVGSLEFCQKQLYTLNYVSTKGKKNATANE